MSAGTVQDAVSRALNSINGMSSWPDKCLGFVANMYGLQGSGTPDPKTAYNAWVTNPYKHPGDTNAPEGALVFWRGRLGSAGHVALSIGNGEAVSTHASNGHPDVYKISDIHIGQYLGWADPAFGATGYKIPSDFGSAPPAQTKNPVNMQVVPGQTIGSGYRVVGTGGSKAEQQQAQQGNIPMFLAEFATNPLGAIQHLFASANPLTAFEAMAGRFLWITLPSSWVRIQAAGAGMIFLILAIILFAWEGSSSG